MTPVDSRIQAALEFAELHHRGQFRDGGLPYIVHPIAVMTRLSKWGIRKEKFPEVWIAALCHDLLEDTDVTVELLQANTDRLSTSYVEHLTFRSRRPDESSKDYQALKSQHLASYVERPFEVQVIKFSDRFENVDDFVSTKPEYAPKYWDRAEGLWKALLTNYTDLKRYFGVGVIKGIFQDYYDIQRRISQCGL